MLTYKLDDWKGTQNALGSIYDKSVGTSFSLRGSLDHKTLTALYRQVPVVATTVDRIVDDAFRNGWRLKDVAPGVDEKKLRSDLDQLGGTDLDFDGVFKKAAKWSRLYGGALIVIPTENGEPDQPLQKPTRIHPLVVEPSYNATCGDYDSALGSATYQKVLWYDVKNLISSVKVHYTRTIKFEPIELPPEELIDGGVNNGWGPSVVDRLFDDLAKAGSAKQFSIAQMYVSSLLLLQLKGYGADSKADPEGTRLWLGEFQKRLNAFGIAAIDAEDKMGSVNLNQTGSHELINKMHDALGAAAGMPREILFRESPAGLNAGELSGPQEIWFADVDAWRQEHLTPKMLRMIKIAAKAWGVDLGPEVSIEWEPLWTKSEEKTAQINKTNAESDNIYYQLGAVSSSEIREHRFVNNQADAVSVQKAEQVEPLDLTAESVPAETLPDQAKPQDEALNGAQISSLLSIVEKTAEGLIPRDAAIEIIRASFPSQAARAEAMLGTAGLAPQVTPGAPTAVPQAPEETDEAGPSTKPPPNDLVSPRKAAELFQVPTATISARMRNGELSWWGLGAQRRVSLAEVADLAKAHEKQTNTKEENAD